MTEKIKTGTARRPYRPPQLEEVQLAVEEAVLQSCKVPSRGTQFGGTCRGGDPPDTTQCFSYGS